MEALTLEALMRSWIAGPLPESYRGTVTRALDAFAEDASTTDALAACGELAMLYGDSGAPELCVVVAYRGIALAGQLLDAEQEDEYVERFLSHAFLALADLGMARRRGDDAVKIAEVAAQMEPDADEAGAWIRSFLAPLGGSLEAGARFAARLAAIRAGVLPVPDPLTLEAVERLRRPQ